MRTLSTFIVALLIIACNSRGNKKEDLPVGKTDTKDTAKQQIQMPRTPATPDTIFTGFGNEPFWAVYVIKNSKIVFHSADGPDVELPFVASSAVNDFTNKYNAASSTATLELIITKKNCSDGMSDETHPYTVALSINKTKYSGCGRETK
ncbi:MAG: hypothetical protein ABJA85_00625 [Bacteroidota bacterium]